MGFCAKSGLKIASQHELGFMRACIRYASLLQPGFVCSEANQRKGLLTRYSTCIGAASGRKFISKSCKTEVDSVLRNNLFHRMFCSEVLRKIKHENYYSRNMKDGPKGNNPKSEFDENPISTIYEVKMEFNGGSISNPLMSSMCSAKKGMQLETRDNEELTDIKKGDIVNLHDLLFTENRDYLVKYNDQKVKAEHLGGKAILIYFVPVSLDLKFVMETEYTTSLIDIYNDLLPNNEFEVVVVAVDEVRADYSFPKFRRDPEKNFELMFSRMPWTAIPFSDIASRKRISRRFGLSGGNCNFTFSFFLNSKGIVLTCNACPYFRIYGTLGYPFTDERVRYLDLEDDEAAKKPSLETLLGSPVRDYVISNKAEKVPIHTLKDKVVALYFYEDGLTDDELTIKLKMAYEAKNDLDGPERPPTLVIFGPNAEFVDPCGGDILMKFGAPAFPFTRKGLARLETEKIKELKLEMLWNPNTVFRVDKDRLEVSSSGNLLNFINVLSKIRSKLEMLWDPITFVRVKHRLAFLPNLCPILELMIPNIKIPFSQYAGKRLLIYFEMGEYYEHSLKLSMMEEIYLQKKGTDDEFEVIHIKKSPSDNMFVARLPWLVHYYGEGYSLPTELEDSIFNFQYDHSRKWMEDCLLLAFERDGSIVRKSFDPTFDSNVFPFYAGGLEKEFLKQINFTLGWYYWEFLSQTKQIYKSRQ